MTRTGRMIAAMAVALALTGCADQGAGQAVPAGEDLVAQARQHYLDYRAVTNDVQALIYDGPWRVEVGSFGMQPTAAGCDGESYAFDLTRTTRVSSEEHDAVRDDVLRYLIQAGYDVERQDLGSGEVQSKDLVVRRQGDFSRLMVTFIANGSVLVTATTRCWPGGRAELSREIFGGVTLSEGYLPREESPRDPLFFGVTPGEPAFTTPPSA